jgi:hypothetical protein
MFPGVKVENYHRCLDSTSRDKRAAVVLFNKDSSAIAYTVLMVVSLVMLATAL